MDEIAELNLGVIDLRGLQRDLPQRFLETAVLGRLDDFPAPVGIVIAATAVDVDPYVDVLLVLLARRRRQRGLDRLENDFAVDTLLVGDGIRD